MLRMVVVVPVVVLVVVATKVFARWEELRRQEEVTMVVGSMLLVDIGTFVDNLTEAGS